MSTYLLTYRMPESYAPGGADVRAAWNAWFESLGASLIDRGNPVFESRPLGECGTGTQPGGYSLIAADDLDTAVRLAGGCPGLRDGAGVEVGVITELNRGPHPLDVVE
ncbi:MAG TPA: hypothetical protein VIJ82_33270 [Streptosporangiaceae bacterium]|jgi:hypothetical protein